MRKPLLDRIVFQLGEVLFSRDSEYRKDLNGDRSIRSVVVKNLSNETVKQFDLSYSYFGPSGGTEEQMRLRLDSLSELSAANGRLKYGFEYEDTYGLPNRVSTGLFTRVYAEDHWGYYNGINNTSFEARHKVKYYGAYHTQVLDELGTASREPNALYAKSGMLKKVKLPTGGHVAFEYEGHSSSDERLPNTVGMSSIPFTLDEQPNNFSISNINEPFSYVTVSGTYGAGFAVAFSIYDNINPALALYTDTLQGVGHKTFRYKFQNGSYSIRAKQIGAHTNPDDHYEVRLKYEVETVLAQKPVGGLRIRKSSLYDPISGTTQKREYYYTLDGSGSSVSPSTGTIANVPQYGIQDITPFMTNQVSYFDSRLLLPQGYIRQLQSSYPLSTTQGSNVGYAKVWTVDNDSLRTEYNFTSYNDFLEFADGFRETPFSDETKLVIGNQKYETHPIAPYDERDFLRGRPLSTVFYRKTGAGFTKVKKQENSYEFNMSMPTVTRAGQIKQHLPDTTEYVEGMLLETFPSETGTGIAFKRHRLYTGRYDLKKTIVTDYHGVDSTKSETSYRYGDSPWFVSSNFHYQPTEISRARSDGALDVDKLYYPYNGYLALPYWNSTELGSFAALSLQNRIASPVLTQRYSNGKLVSATKDVYGYFTTSSGSILDVSDILKYNTVSQSFEPEVKIVNRNTYGHIVETRNKLGPSTTYLYSYNGQLPVAEIRNAGYPSVEGVLTGAPAITTFSNLPSPDKSAVDAFLLPLKTALPDAHITSYTYKPLVGLTSQTDPKGMTISYTYDTFNRLENIKDQNGDIVKNYKYGYADGTAGPPVAPTYRSAAVTVYKTKNNCTTGIGSEVGYTILALKYTSTVSQAAADQQARADAEAGAQANANSLGTCTTPAAGTVSLNYSLPGTVQFILRIINATTNAYTDHPLSGDGVLNNIPSGTFNLALSEVTASSNTYNFSLNGVAKSGNSTSYDNFAFTANASLTITTAPSGGPHYNTAQTISKTKSNCPSGTGTAVSYTVAANSYSSPTSVADANLLALAGGDAAAQANANALGGCTVSGTTTYYSQITLVTKAKNNCPNGVSGVPLEISYYPGSHTSLISVADADLQVHAAAQQHANSMGGCAITSGTYTLNFTAPLTSHFSVHIKDVAGNTLSNPTFGGSHVLNNLPGGTGSITITATTAFGAKFSYNLNGVVNNSEPAQFNGVALTGIVNLSVIQTTFMNQTLGITKTKNNCPSGQVGSSVTYTVQENRYSSTISQADANQKARDQEDVNAQNYANTNGTCTAAPPETPFTLNYGVPFNKQFLVTITDTVANTSVSYTISSAGAIYNIPGGKNSYVSVTSLNATGLYNFSFAGQYKTGTSVRFAPVELKYTLSLGIGIVTFYNSEITVTKTRNCPSGQVGSSVTYTVPANTCSSTISQADADQQADTYAQNYANENGFCSLPPTYYNTYLSVTKIRNNCAAGYTGTSVIYTVPNAKYSSIISQADANQKAQDDADANAQDYANTNGSCTPPPTYYSAYLSVTKTRNNCAVGYTGTTVTYTVPGAKYTSIISQADADQKAQADADANAQNYANANGTCTPPVTYYSSSISIVLKKNNCPSGETGLNSYYYVPYGKYTSLISQADANQKAQDDINANGQNYVNTNGSCVPSTFSIDYTIPYGSKFVISVINQTTGVTTNYTTTGTTGTITGIPIGDGYISATDQNGAPGYYYRLNGQYCVWSDTQAPAFTGVAYFPTNLSGTKSLVITETIE